MGQAQIVPKSSDDCACVGSQKNSFFGPQQFNSRLVSQSWLEVLSAAQLSDNGSVEVHGMTLFQDCFFDILKQKDRDGEVATLMCSCKDKTKPGYKSPAIIMIVIARFISTLTKNEREVTPQFE